MLTATATAATPEPAPDEAPSAELLLYLSEFEDASGEFVDPLSLEEGREPAAEDALSTEPAPEDEDRDEAAPRAD